MTSLPSVQQWLESLLLPQYLNILLNNGYDTVHKCSSLTSDELDRIGISMPGHKKRILQHRMFKEHEEIPPSSVISRQPDAAADSEAAGQLNGMTGSYLLNPHTTTADATDKDATKLCDLAITESNTTDKGNSLSVNETDDAAGSSSRDSEYSNFEIIRQLGLSTSIEQQNTDEPPTTKKRVPIPTPRVTVQPKLIPKSSNERQPTDESVTQSSGVSVTANGASNKHLVPSAVETVSTDRPQLLSMSASDVIEMPSTIRFDSKSVPSSSASTWSAQTESFMRNGISVKSVYSTNLCPLFSTGESLYSDACSVDPDCYEHIRPLPCQDPFDLSCLLPISVIQPTLSSDLVVGADNSLTDYCESLDDVTASDVCPLIGELEEDEEDLKVENDFVLDHLGNEESAIRDSTSRDSKESYVQLWDCKSSDHNAVYSLETAVSDSEGIGVQRDIIRSENSPPPLTRAPSCSSTSSSSREEIFIPPLPPKRSVSDASSNPLRDLVCPRTVDSPPPPCFSGPTSPSTVPSTPHSVLVTAPLLPSKQMVSDLPPTQPAPLPPGLPAIPARAAPPPPSPCHRVEDNNRPKVTVNGHGQVSNGLGISSSVVNGSQSSVPSSNLDTTSSAAAANVKQKPLPLPAPEACSPCTSSSSARPNAAPVSTSRSPAADHHNTEEPADHVYSPSPIRPLCPVLSRPRVPTENSIFHRQPSVADHSNFPSLPRGPPVLPAPKPPLVKTTSGGAASSVLNRVIAIGGVNVMGIAAQNGPRQISPSNRTDVPVPAPRVCQEGPSGDSGNSAALEMSTTPTGARMPLVPRPKVGLQLTDKTANSLNVYSLAMAVEEEDTGDEELNDDDHKNTSFADSDGALSDGGEFYSLAFQRPAALTAAIPIVKASKTKWTERKGYLFKFETEPRSVARLGTPWKKFWVTFDGVSLKYYSSNKSFVSRRIIPVSIMVNIAQEIKTGDVHNFRFRLSTIDRVYTFAADDADSLSLWSSIIMQAIIGAKVNPDTFVEGGEMCDPIMQGFVRMDGVKGKVYLAIKKFRLCCYKTVEDFKSYTPVHQIEMQTASVKDLSKCRLQVYTPHVAFVFQFDTMDELNRWKEVFQESIQLSLGDDLIANEVYKNHSNRLCADCDANDPDWASISLGITICKHCAGVHRSLSFSKVRSLRMDSKAWKPSVIQLMLVIGNNNANEFWDWKTTEDDRIDTSSDDSARKAYIYKKYQDRLYCQLHPLHGDQLALNEALCKSVQFGDILETMQLVFSGANIHCTSEMYSNSAETPLELAQNANQIVQMEFIYQNDDKRFLEDSLQFEPVSPRRGIELSHRGYLLKTGSNTKGDFRRRWCTLENGVLSYYDNEKCTIATCTIDRKEMLGVRITDDDRVEFAFELATTRNSGRVFLFSAESADERKNWMLKLAKTMAKIDIIDIDGIREFHDGGNVFTRLGSTTEWHSTWIHLVDKILYVYSNEEQFVEYDLRHAKSVAFVQQTEKCLEAFDEGPPIVVDLPNRALYIQSDIGRETETWSQVLQKALLEVSNVLSSQPLSNDNVPLTVEKCINFMMMYGLKVEGIYRINGQHSTVTQLLEHLAADARTFVIKFEEYQVHDVATALRRFVRSLSEPLLTDVLRSRWLETSASNDDSAKQQWYKYLLGELPAINYSTLKRIITHLARVAELESMNKMSAINLASIFGPILMNVDKPEQATLPQTAASGFNQTRDEIIVVKDLIDHHRWLFGVKDCELEQERKMDEAAKKIERLNSNRQSKPAEEDFLIGVYIKNYNDSNVVSNKISRKVVAHELLAFVIEKAQLDAKKCCWSLFEVVCDGHLERPLHSMEPVVDVTFKWSSWPAEFCQKAHLCVKHNYIYEGISSVVTPQMSLFCELRYAEKKSYRKYSFEFSKYSLSYRSSSKAAVPTASWNIEDLVVYNGTQQQRNPPTKWAFTFYSVNDTISSPYFGHSVCCSGEQELYRWLAAMLHAQHPEGLMPNGPTGSPVIQRNLSVGASSSSSSAAAAAAGAGAGGGSTSGSPQAEAMDDSSGQLSNSARQFRKILNKFARR